MGLIQPRLGITAVVVALVVGAVIWYGESHPPVPVEKPQPVAAAPAAVPKTIAAPPEAAPVAEAASPVVVAAEPAKAAPAADPEATELLRRAAQDRKVVLKRYGKLFDQLGLDPEQREKLTQILINNREASVDFAGATAAAGVDLTQDHDAFAAGVYEQRQQIKDQIRQLLGDDGYAAFHAGEEAIKQASVVDRAQKELKGSGAKLTKAQAGQLQGVLQDLGANHVDDAVLDRASSFLSEPQLDALRKQQVRRANGEGKERVQAAVRKNMP